MASSSKVLGFSTALLAVLGISCRDCVSPLIVSPGSLELVSGDAQRATVGNELSRPLTVRVVDRDGRPMLGATVLFVITAGDGSLSAGSVVTNGEGIGEDRWTLGTSTADAQAVQARVAIDESRGLY